MSKEYLKGTPQQEARSYSSAIIATGRTIYLAGVGGAEDESGKSLAGDFAGQTRATFNNLRKALEKAGAKLEDIVTMQVYVTDMKYGLLFVQMRKEFFPAGRYPCSALIGINQLARHEMMIEIQAIAVVD